MKRIKTLFLALALTTLLAGNIFATGGIVSTATLTASLLTSAVNAVLSLMGTDDQCPTRQCTNCRPNSDGDGDGNGNCRPTPN